jgi:hypothetical protein
MNAMKYLLNFDNDVNELMGCVNDSIFEFEKKKISATTGANSTESTLNQNTMQMMLSTHDEKLNAGAKLS